MIQIRLIAWREYRQYVFSRGFLLFVIMFPIGLIAIGFGLDFLERNKPTRYFTVYDETGAYTEDIDREIERRHMRRVLSAWDSYVATAVDPAALEAGRLAAPFAPDDINEKRLRAFAEAGGLDAATEAAAPFLRAQAPALAPPKRAFKRVALPGDAAGAPSLAETEARLRPYLLGERRIVIEDQSKELFAAILIPASFGAEEGATSAQFWSRNLTDQALEMTVANALDDGLRRDAARALGLSEGALDELASLKAPLSAFRPDRAPQEAELSLKDRIETALPAGLTYMLVVIIFGVGNLLLTNTIEERSNKIVEMLLSSVTANQLMMGKLIGIAAVGLTMPAIFLAGGAALGAAAASDAGFLSAAMETLFSTNILFVYLFYFLAAYFIFAMIFLAIGAVSNSLQDAQSYMGPVMLIVLAPLPLMLLVFQNPNGVAASVLTWIPIYTPYAVMMRAAADPPLWEIVGATALMLAFAIFMMRIMGRIFRQAILQASPPRMREVWRLARKDAA